MNIYDFEGFPNPARIRIALAEKGATDKANFISVNVPEGEHRQAAYLAKNPVGVVPMLELDCGTCISECTAITEYIDNEFPGISLTGSTAKEKAVVHMMQRRTEQQVLDAAADYFHHATPGLGPDLETNQLPEWGQRRGEQLKSGMRYFNELLADQPYVAGNNFSMADITLYTGLMFADFGKIETPAELNHLTEWRQRMAQRPSIAA